MQLNKYLDKEYAPETREFKRAGGIVLSPSAISKYFDNPGDWWQDRTGVPTFDGNTATVLGNAIHGSIDSFYDNEIITEDEVEQWIRTKYAVQMDTVAGRAKGGAEYAKVEIHEILADYPSMFEAFKNEYAALYPKPDQRETFTKMELDEKIIMSGTFDGYESDRKVLIDYKTTGKKPSGMSKAHQYQLTSYAVSMIADGQEVDTIRVVYIVRPTKKLPARVFVYDMELTDEMLMTSVKIMENMKKSVLAVKENPDLEDIIFRTNPLSLWN